MLILLLLVGSMVLGLILLVTGAISLIKMKNKLFGILCVLIGLVFTLSSSAVFLYLLVAIPVRS